MKFRGVVPRPRKEALSEAFHHYFPILDDKGGKASAGVKPIKGRGVKKTWQIEGQLNALCLLQSYADQNKSKEVTKNIYTTQTDGTQNTSHAKANTKRGQARIFMRVYVCFFYCIA